MWRKLFAAYVALVVGLLIGCAIGAYVTRKSDAKNAVVTDIGSLRSSSAKYAGELVKVRGKLDECYGWECSLCPESMTTAKANPDQCLPLEFQSLVPKTGFGEEEKEGVFRFASVTLVARFDPTCFKKGVCVDRQVVLTNADVVSLDTRRSSREGLWLGEVSPLQEMASGPANEIRIAALQAGFPPEPPMKVFSVKGDENVAVVCWTPVMTNSWPNSLEGALYARSINDNYRCNKALQISGRWIVQTQS